MDTGWRRFCPRESAPFSAMAARQRCGDSGRRNMGRSGSLSGGCPASIGYSHRPPPRDSSHRKTAHDGIPVTAVVRTLVDVSTRQDASGIERAVYAADTNGLVNPEALWSALVAYAGRPGVAGLRAILDRRTFRLTDFELQRRFPDSGRQGSLEPAAETRRQLNGFRVDFCRPDMRLVVETDGLRSHHTLGAASLRSPARPGPHRRRPDPAPHNSPAGAVRPSCVREILLATVGGRF